MKTHMRDSYAHLHVRRPGARGSFTLIELLVVIAIIAILGAILVPALSYALDAARSVQCLSQMRQIGVAAQSYIVDNCDQFPRSQHSAFAYKELPWERLLASSLGASDVTWTNLLKGVYHCASDMRENHLSYCFNVYFELGTDDDYPGKPQTWHWLSQIPKPADTVFLAENAAGADHAMAHFWMSVSDAEGEVDSKRHRRKSNYIFVDGHGELLPLICTYNPPQLDQWNPQR
jgi:prepilin-type N-terminal cleavage/methylation domain-containing protein/prepilin-type processing-associated H-X9-DG protein